MRKCELKEVEGKNALNSIYLFESLVNAPLSIYAIYEGGNEGILVMIL